MADIDPKTPLTLELERKVGSDANDVTLHEKADISQADITTIKADAGATRTLAEGATGFAAIKAETALVKADTTNLLANLAIVDGKIVVVDGKVQDVKDAVTNPVYGLAALQTILAALESANVTRFETLVLPQMMRPESGDIYYLGSIIHYGESGNLENFASDPTVQVLNESGTDLGIIYDAPAGTNVTAATNVGTGRYVFYIKTAYNITPFDGSVKITAIENVPGGGTRTLIKSIPVSVQQYFNATFNSGDRTLLNTAVNNSNTLLTNLAAAMTKTGGTFNRDTMSLEALAEGLATIIAGTNKKVSAYKRSGAITQGNSEVVVLDSTLTSPSVPFAVYDALISDIEVLPTTTTSSNFLVEVFSDVALTRRWFRAQKNKSANGDLELYGMGKMYENTDSPRAMKIYVRITNITDSAPGGSIFDVRIKGTKAVE